MHKSIIITGPNGSGKTSIARDIASKFFPNEEVAFIEGYKVKLFENPFLFHQCHRNTKVVLIDDIMTKENLYQALELDRVGIKVNQRAKPYFMIDSYLILVCSENITKEQVKEIGSEHLESFIHINIEK